MIAVGVHLALVDTAVEGREAAVGAQESEELPGTAEGASGIAEATVAEGRNSEAGVAFLFDA